MHQSLLITIKPLPERHSQSWNSNLQCSSNRWATYWNSKVSSKDASLLSALSMDANRRRIDLRMRQNPIVEQMATTTKSSRPIDICSGCLWIIANRWAKCVWPKQMASSRHTKGRQKATVRHDETKGLDQCGEHIFGLMCVETK